MEPKGSLPYFHELTTGPCLEPDGASPQLSTLFLLRTILILFFYVCLGLLSGLFPSGFLTKTLYALYAVKHFFFVSDHSRQEIH